MSTTLYAQYGDPSTQWMSDFSGGLNVYENPLLLKDNESPLLKNVLLDQTGAITSRPGFKKLNASAIGGGSNDVNAVYQFNVSTGTKYCVAFSSSNGYASQDGCATFTSFVSTLTVGNDVNCDSLNDKLFCVNNSYNFYFDGTNNISFGAPANSQYIRVNRNRCWTAGASGNLSRLTYSNLADCTSWNNSVNYIDIGKDDGDVITGIGFPIYDSLPIFKKYSTWVLKGVDPNTFVLLKISANTGAVNQRSMQVMNNKEYFDSLGPSGGQPGIYSFNGIRVEEASKKLRSEIDNLDTLNTSTTTTSSTTPASAVFQNRYHYAAESNGGSGNDTMYILDSNGAWVKWDDMRARSLAVVNKMLVVGDSSTVSGGFLYQLYTGTSDNGTAFTAKYQTKDFPLGELSHVKSVDNIYTVYHSSASTVTFDLIGQNVFDNSYTLNLSTGLPFFIKQFVVEPPMTSNWFRLGVSDATLNEKWGIHALGFKYRDIGLIVP